MTARVLDQGGLDRFELALRRAQAPVLGHLRKGLSGAEMDALTESIGIRLPPEARTWWGWHDGAEIDVLWAREREVGPSMPFISLAEAVDQARWWREVSSEFEQTLVETGGERETWWPEHWLPITCRGGAGTIALDCGADAGDSVAVTRVTLPEAPPNWGGMGPPRLASLAELIDAWTLALSCGAWDYGVDRGWVWWPERLPSHHRELRFFL